MKRLISIKLLLFVLLSWVFLSCKTLREQEPVFDVGELWRKDTCGMFDDRIKIAPLLVKHSKELIGLPQNEILLFFGPPDDIYDGNEWLLPDSEIYVYSTSSWEKVADKCGTPKSMSFWLILDKKSTNLKELREIIH